MEVQGQRAARRGDHAAWKAAVEGHQRPDARRAILQLCDSVGVYLALWVALYFSLRVSWWLTVPLAVLAGAVLVRVFIIFHDCGHGSFFASRRANDTWGFITGLLTFTPYEHWRWEHSVHHASSGNLDKRGMGDVWTMTVREFLEAPFWTRVRYRIARNPVVLFAIAPALLFIVWQRIPTASAGPRERRSVWLMNVALALVVTGLGFLFGWLPMLAILTIVLTVAGAAGVWMFYVQHQFEQVYWAHDADWDYTKAALEGSSYYQLPRVLQWFSGNIGFHHVHHLSPRIPNYNLERCHRASPLFQNVTRLTLRTSMRSLSLRMWDESSRRLVGYAHLRSLRGAAN